MKRLQRVSRVVCLAFGSLALGCSQGAPSADSANPPAAAVDGKQFLLAAEPAGAASVIEAREAAQDGDEIVVVGRIGGGQNPWIEGRAAFTLVDGSLKACSDIPGDKCPKPWDYCCETDKLPTSTALVKVVDSEGRLVEADARELLSVKELSTVVVTGTAQRDESGNLTVLARGVYVKSAS